MDKITFALIALLILNSVVGFSQKPLSTKSKRAIKNYNLALNQYQQRNLKDAIFYIDEAIDNDSMFVEAHLFKADISNLKSDVEQEIFSYEKAMNINPDVFTYTRLNLGKAYLNNGQYSKAIDLFADFIEQGKGREHTLSKAAELIEKCEYAIHLKSNAVNFDPINLGANINNLNDQYWPSLSLDGKTLIYTELLTDSSRISKFGDFAKQEDFYISFNENGNWSLGTPIGEPLNTPGNEGAHKLSADGNAIVFTGCNRRDGFGNCDIYYSYKINGEWSVPKNMGRSINSAFSEKQPCLSPDGRYLYFSSNRPHGQGGMDIWVSMLLDDGYWSSAINLGDNINTKGDEVSPFIHPDNSTFYFSSSGHLGMGQKDIFISRIDSNRQWSEPINIGYPINTHHDEIGLVVDAKGELAYYSTNFESSSTDIYSFKMPLKVQPTAVSYISGRIFDAITNKSLNAGFQLLDLETGDTIMQANSDLTNGKYLVCLPIGKNYALNVNYPEYLFYSVNFNLRNEHSSIEPYILDIPLNRIQIGNRVVLKNIFFDTDSYELKSDSEVELAKIYEFAIKNPDLILEVGGYTDNKGDVSYNIDLSNKRAKAVHEYLINKGVPDEQLSYKGYGQENPIDKNDTKEGRAVNRRTELKIIDQVR